MNKTIFSVIILSILIIPQVTLAAWWNPLSWNWRALFNSPTTTEIQTLPETTLSSFIENKPVQSVTPSTTSDPVKPPPVSIPSHTVVPTSKNIPTTPIPTQTSQIQSSVTIPTLKLQITDVKNSITKKKARITWTTSIPSRSQLLLDNGDGKGYESMNGISTTHEINVDNPTPSTEYIYKIVARTDDGKIVDDYYGSFTAIREFVATLEGTEDGCRVVYIKDSIGKPASYMEVSLSGSYGTNGGFQLPRSTATTDITGKIKDWPHCKTTKTLIITGENLDAKLLISNSINKNGNIGA